MKYLKLNFRNAGYFQDSSRSKDFIFDLGGQKKRAEGNRYVAPITAHHISNMLHVLMGERPKASLRQTLIEKQEDIFQIANNSYLKIDSFTALNKTKNEYYYPRESMTLRKAVWNSFYTTQTLIYWKRIENLLEEDLSLQFITLLDKLFKCDTIMKYSCESALTKLNKEFLNNKELQEFIILLKAKGKMPLVNAINGQLDASMNMNDRTLITTTFGVDYITRISGSIIVPLDELHLEKIKQNKGTATLLDGGFVYIESLEDGGHIDADAFDNYTKVSDISVETINIKTKKDEAQD